MRLHHDFTFAVLNYSSSQTAKQIGGLRCTIFAHQLGWVPIPANGIETDRFDQDAVHLGVCENGELVGYLRIIHATAPYGMLFQQPSFSALVPSNLQITASDAEVSRLCISPPYQRSRYAAEILKLLMQGVLKHAQQQNIARIFAVADDQAVQSQYSHQRFLTRRLRFVVIGEPHQFVPTINTYLMVLDVPAEPQSAQAKGWLG